MSDELEQLANKWDQVEEEQIAPPEQNTGQPEVETSVVEPSEDAGEMAAFAVGALNGVLSIFEPRLELDDYQEQSRGDMAPVVEKYELHKGTGGDALGFAPEINAGLFLGRYLKSIFSQFRFWRASDREQEENNKHGEERKHQSTQSTRPIPSAERIREESNPQAQSGDSYAGLAVDSVG